MDTGTGNIYPQSEIKLEDIKGNLIKWRVGEIVECKNCRFEVKEIRCFPENEIVLRGRSKLEDIFEL